MSQANLRRKAFIFPPDPPDLRSVPWRVRRPATAIARQRAACGRAALGDRTGRACLCPKAPKKLPPSPWLPDDVGQGKVNRSQLAEGLPRCAECAWQWRDRAAARAEVCAGSKHPASLVGIRSVTAAG